MYRQVINSSRLHLLYCKWSLEFHVHNVCTRTQFNLYSYNVYIRIWIKDHIYTKITSTCTFIKVKCHIKILRQLLYHFFHLTTKEFWSDMVLQYHQDIFIFKNLMTHIVCHHYVHMMHVKFLQETNQMNKYELRPHFYYLFK